MGAASLELNAKEHGYADVILGVGLTTQSTVYEHRGILVAERNAIFGAWQMKDYLIKPPLKDPAESVQANHQ